MKKPETPPEVHPDWAALQQAGLGVYLAYPTPLILVKLLERGCTPAAYVPGREEYLLEGGEFPLMAVILPGNPPRPVVEYSYFAEKKLHQLTLDVYDIYRCVDSPRYAVFVYRGTNSSLSIHSEGQPDCTVRLADFNTELERLKENSQASWEQLYIREYFN